MKIYIGCAIQGLAPELWETMKVRLAELKETLANRGHEILNFRSNENRQAEVGTVFKWDYQQCMDCDAMIALAIHPSTGMGMEIALCLTRSPNPARVLALAPRHNNTSRMVKECDLPGYAYQEFDDWVQISELFEKFCGLV